MPSHPLDDIVAAVRLAALLAEEQSCPPADLHREIYLGLYACRCATSADIAEVSRIVPQMDLEFARFATDVEGTAPKPWRCPVLARDERGAIFDLMGVTVRSVDDGAADSVSIPVPVFLLYASPGFIVRMGDRPLGNDTSRLYLALSPEQAPWFLGRLFETLRKRLRGLSAKVLANPRSYARADTAVLYVDSAELDPALEMVTASLAESGVALRPVCPLGTKSMQAGLAWADSPEAEGGVERSFGELIAAIVTDAARHGAAAHRRRLKALIEARGRCPDAPFRRTPQPITSGIDSSTFVFELTKREFNLRVQRERAVGPD
jgi:hypothetical protein